MTTKTSERSHRSSGNPPRSSREERGLRRRLEKAATRAMARDRRHREEEREGCDGNFAGPSWSRGCEGAEDLELEQGDYSDLDDTESEPGAMPEFTASASVWKMRDRRHREEEREGCDGNFAGPSWSRGCEGAEDLELEQGDYSDL